MGFDVGNIQILEEPKILSRKNREYAEIIQRFTSNLSTAYLLSLGEILLYTEKEIFTKQHLKGLNHNLSEFRLGNNKYTVYSEMVEILIGIYQKKWSKNEVLHDLAQLLSHEKKDEFDLKKRIYEHLVKDGFVKGKIR